jgi:hypothetical protein
MFRFVAVLVVSLVGGCRPSAERAAPPEAVVVEQGARTESARTHEDLDTLVRGVWREVGAQPAPRVSDAEFSRRVTIDLVGRTPTLKEVEAFEGDRAWLVDRLLASDDYAEHWADVYLDVLISRKAQANRRFAKGPRAYLRAVFSEGRSYKRFAYEVLTAAGPLYNDGAGAFLAGHPRREDMALATAEVFLGMPEYACAQCHDHPFDPGFEQGDFHALAAHFARTSVRNYQGMLGPATEVFDRDKGEHRRKKPGEKAEVIEPAVLGQPTEVGEDESRRQALARVVLDSPRFAETAVRRTWAQLFGVPPGDEMEPVVQHLTEAFVAQGHDLRWLARRLVLSEAYQRSARVVGLEHDPVQAFGRMRLRPLPARTLYRSLLYATTLTPEAPHMFPSKHVQAYENRALNELLGAEDPSSVAGNLNGALHLLIDTLTQKGSLAKPGGRLRWVLDAKPDAAKRLDALYKIAYGRPPTEDELAHDLELLEGGDDETKVYEDLWFSMLTSSEFLTNH